MAKHQENAFHYFQEHNCGFKNKLGSQGVKVSARIF